VRFSPFFKISCMKKRLFYVWSLPLLWGVFSIFSFYFSGDKHGCFAIATIAGAWICFLHQFDTLGKSLFPILITGGIVLGLTGIIMDWLGIQKKLWLSLFILFLVVFLSLRSVNMNRLSTFAGNIGLFWR